ncbi:branched-chain amino acid aminotransferase [Paenibacillus xylaniclasticus]|uniref:branched-chain amino acid aminotransferase n=1 Tax=Paenibacillus xylaniclasticus TaxID=588083 RepID=UPI000FDBD7E0|nr:MULTISPECIES: branched-chain amino acid aminotransferase [Paenibacillus]GFN34025.1 branched-chain-amino-acid aminotransferase 2 [Paenibacillus curdlanolyticus]
MLSKVSISVTRTSNPKPRPDEKNLVFGKTYTDHMFIMEYDAGQGWHDARVVPYQNISLDPAAKVFHYGQTIFEGLKAYRTDDNRIVLFRPDQNWQRLNRSNERLSIPAIDPEVAHEALRTLIDVDREWVPSEPGTSLYIRPFVIATEPALGVSPSLKYLFMIIMSPVGAYYSEGLNPVPIHVESEYVRAVKGGVGNAKTAGNYAASLKAQEGAAELGYSQVLWLDGVHRKYIEEVGSMNVFFKINGTVVTPELNGSILDGITRKSVLQLLRSWNVPVEERTISIDELVEAHKNGTLEEAFGTGTAAVISPVGALHYAGEKFVINNNKTGELSSRVYDTITGIQRTELPDPFGWVVEV